MQTIITGAFFVLHGLVHLLYVGQSRRLFELRPRMAWPDGSWAFSRLLGDETARRLASISLILVALGFLAGGVGLFMQQAWWRPVSVGSAMLSIAIYILFWDGKFRALDQKGAVALLINLAILCAVLIFRWPS
jgi:hypothetical protein